MSDRLLYQLRNCGHVDTDIPLSDLTTFRIGGPARLVIYPKNSFALVNVIDILKKNGVDYKILGNGSNILSCDRPYDGAIIKLSRTFADFSIEEDIMTAQAGCSIIFLAYAAMKAGLSGLEFASGIPGTLGGCLFMNAGAYLSSMSDIVSQVQIIQDDQVRWLDKEECGFGYRTSIFHQHPEWIILSARLLMRRGSPVAIRRLMDQRQAKRMATQPLDMPCAGSVFRNPPGKFAWQFIDGIGYRGKQNGGAAVSAKHPNFIVNNGQASGEQVVELIDEIRAKVKESYDIDLIPEVERFNWPKK